jgi:hypothetical protein
MADLSAELVAAVARVRQPHLNRLCALGVPAQAIVRLGAEQPPFGVSRIRTLEDGLFELDADGADALIIPVMQIRQGDWCGFDMSHPEVVDMIALRTAEPDRWWWRVGTGWALGTEHLGCDAPLRVVATPLDWIAAAGRALCILDWSAPGWCWDLLRSELQLILPDDRLRRRLRNALVRHASMPDMEVTHAA